MIADETLGLHLGERLKLGKETYTVVGIASPAKGLPAYAGATLLLQ